MSELDVNAPAVAAWRTVILTGFMLLLLAACYSFAVKHGLDAFSAQAFGSLCTAGTASCAAVALKALGEHLGNGSGVKGAISSLMSNTKPGDPAQGAQP